MKPDVPERGEPQDGSKTARGLDREPEWGFHRRQSLARGSGIEFSVDRLPLAERERLRPPFGIDARLAQATRGARAGEANDAAQRSAQPRPAKVEHRRDD